MGSADEKAPRRLYDLDRVVQALRSVGNSGAQRIKPRVDCIVSLREGNGGTGSQIAGIYQAICTLCGQSKQDAARKAFDRRERLSDLTLFVPGVVLGWLITYMEVLELRKKLESEKKFNERVIRYLEMKDSTQNIAQQSRCG